MATKVFRSFGNNDPDLDINLTTFIVSLTISDSNTKTLSVYGARCSSVVRAFAHGVIGRRIDPSWGGPIELFLVPASAPRLV